MLKGAIVGFGDVARHGHWPAYAGFRDVAIVAVVDRTAERRAVAAALPSGPATFASLAELAASTPVDFVDICTPPALHAAPVLDAVDRGWHVVCEKPFLIDPVHVDMVRTQAAARGVAVVPVHNWKYAPIVQRATAALRSGRIGRLRAVEIETLRLRDCATADPVRPNWRRDAAIAGGGILMDHGWHAVYLALHWFGERPLDLDATLHRAEVGAVEDEAQVRMRFPSGDASLVLTWNADTRRNRMRLVGERGVIAIDDDVLRVEGGAVEFAPALSAGSHHADWFAAMLPDVVAAFRDPARARETFDEAAACLETIRRAYASARWNGLM